MTYLTHHSPENRMLSGMKPLPKALIIFAPIALAVFLYIKFVPEKKVEAPVAPVAVQVVPAEQPALTVEATPVPATALPAPVQAAEPADQSAGMKALLEKGKK